MADIKTFDGTVTPSDPLIAKQKKDVAEMRASLLCCGDDPYTTKAALQKITILRIYHQMSKVIRFLEMMDKIEAKLYESLDYTLESMDVESPTSWLVLMKMQNQLQDNMIESHKMLQPYLDMLNSAENFVDVYEQEQIPENSILSQDSRDRLRIAAQSVLENLDELDAS